MLQQLRVPLSAPDLPNEDLLERSRTSEEQAKDYKQGMLLAEETSDRLLGLSKNWIQSLIAIGKAQKKLLVQKEGLVRHNEKLKVTSPPLFLYDFN